MGDGILAKMSQYLHQEGQIEMEISTRSHWNFPEACIVRILEPLSFCSLWRSVWHYVITPSSRLIIAENQHCLVVLRGVCDGIEDLLLDPSTIFWLVWGMLNTSVSIYTLANVAVCTSESSASETM